MEFRVLKELEEKSITKEQLLKKVKQDDTQISELIEGVSSNKASIRYGCAKVLNDLSEEEPEKLYSHMDFFITLLDSKFRILTWNAIGIIANLAKVDTENKFDSIFDKYYQLIENEYMVTVANVVGNSGKIALAKPHLTEKITTELLKVPDISTTPHLSEECKRVIVQHTIKSFNLFYPQIEQKDKVIRFVRKHVNSSRKSLQKESEKFLKKWE